MLHHHPLMAFKAEILFERINRLLPLLRRQPLVGLRVDVGLIHKIAAAPALRGNRLHLTQRAGQVLRQQAGYLHHLGAVVGVVAL